MEFTLQLMQQPWWLLLWLTWMGAVNMIAATFLDQREARWVLGVFLGNFVLMNLLFAANGYNRLLGLPHVLFWTPLLVYLFGRLASHPPAELFGKWLRVLIATNLVSLVIDYIDVLRYALGERG